MRVISIANFKGGTGKTVTACNLAALLARDGLRVLLIDADAQHNSTDFFGGDPEGCSLTDVLEGTGEQVAADNLQETELDNLDLLAADMGLLRLDLAAIMSQANAPLRRFDDFLDAVREDDEYDFVIIDCPPSFTASSVAALVAADEVILPTRVDAFSRLGTLELIAQVRSLLRYDVRPRFRTLVTMVDRRARISFQAVNQLHRDGLDVFDTVIHSSAVVSESTYERLALYESAPKLPAAQDYEALAKEVLGNG